MERKPLKVTRIGNSRGVRIPAATLRRYGVGEAVLMEERPDGILLVPVRSGAARLTWEQTARAMVRAREDWTDFDSTSSDGLTAVEWSGKRPRRVAEGTGSYKASRRKRKR